ncbi:MAG: MerR family transcriptional regulator [Bacteroidetes bacterium]|nr:MAG: MerR family transcriptional regulator [Bacteroidota bacterium]
MGTYSISRLEQLSGIKAHTIRIWEQRYKIFTPKRSEGNVRSYNDQQLRKLLNIVSLSNTGLKVSELCRLSEKDLAKLLDRQIELSKTENAQFEYFISQLIISGLNYEEADFEKAFSACLLRFGFKNCYVNVIYPMMVRIGLMWGKDEFCPAQEHFLSNLLRQKFCTAIDALPAVSSKKPTWVLFLPEDEFHDLGLLFSSFLLRQHGEHVIYLGSNVPLDSIKDIVKDVQPKHLLLFMVRHSPADEVQDYISQLERNFKDAKIHVAGNAHLAENLKLSKRTDWISDISTFELNYLK